MLCGYPPFNGDDDDEIIEAVKQADLEFDEEDWAHISEGAKALIKRMLTLNPKRRPSAADAMNDPWIQKNSLTHNIKKHKVVFQNFTNFRSTSKFRYALITYIARRMVTAKEKETLREAFLALDKDGNGTLNKEEIMEGYGKVFGNCTQEVIKAEVERIMQSVDINNSGQIDFSEFLVAAMDPNKLMSLEGLIQAFRLFDDDGNGYIEISELKEIMSGLSLSDEDWQILIEEYDTDHDGKISFDEFKKIISPNFKEFAKNK